MSIHICDFLSVPGKTECLAAIWSEGRACRKCEHPTCYRRGWPKRRVDKDNERLVRANGGMWWDEKDDTKMERQARRTAAQMESPSGRKKLGLPPMNDKDFVPDMPGDTPEKQWRRKWGDEAGKY